MNGSVITPEAPKEKGNVLTPSEIVFAWICLISAYLFCRVFPVTLSPMGGFLLTLCLYIVTTVFIKIKGGKLKFMPILAAISALLMSSALVLSSNGVIRFFAYSYALMTYIYYVYSAFGNSLKKGFSDLVLIDYFKALFILPYVRFIALFVAVFSNKKGNKAFRRIVIGICIAVIPTLIVLALLSYDSAFTDLLDKIFNFSLGDLWSHFVSFLFAFPIAAYGFGLFIASKENRCQKIIDAEGCQSASAVIKIIPALTSAVATLPIFVLYVIFFISQWKYYISGFTGVLPKGFVYSRYAREGFFQLCVVSVINLIIISVVSTFSKKNTKPSSVAKRIICILYSLSSLVLIATAMAKLSMYIGIYGLTPLRVYAAWLEIVLALIFILVILKQFIPKFNLIISSFAVLVLCFALLCVGNVEGFIANYNVDRYLNDKRGSVDVELLRDLGDAAVPALIRLEKGTENNNKYIYMRVNHDNVAKTLDGMAERMLEREKDMDIFSYTLPTYRAKALLKDRMDALRDKEE
ncbi:MAG: DUF4173 domain-containing protein [Clostridia bacterium]|nr:DUF4173 domain-containing protein [Clostridia bacterium]